jgi:hypothetical protein
MYSPARYRSDLKKAWEPVHKAIAAFGKKLPTLDPFKYFEPCLVMCARLMLFTLQFAFFTGRKLANF